jgi:hypothetical protein
MRCPLSIGRSTFATLADRPLLVLGISLVLILGASLSLIAFADNDMHLVTVPVLSDCVEEAKAKIRAAPDRAPIQRRYVEFDRLLLTHPDVVGYIELKSSEYERERLVALGNGFIAGCDIDTEATFEKSSDDEARRLFQSIRGAENQGAKVIYLVNEEDAVHLFFRRLDR